MLAPLAALAAAAATVEPAALSGIWEGSIGNLPVRACFVSRDWSRFGAYYYLSHRRMIPLEAEGESGAAFLEGSADEPRRPRWTMERAEADRLTGRWTGSGRSLPVRLTRIARGGDEDATCGALAFHLPRIEGVRTVAGSASLDGVSFTRLALEHDGRFPASVETFALDGTSDAVRRLNDTLRQPLAGDPPEWLDCLLAAQEHGPQGGDFQQSLSPTLIATRWMSVVEQYDHYCGGNHPNSGRTYRTFDLATGEEIDLHDWLTQAAATRERPDWSDVDIRRLRPEFRDFILAGRRAAVEECEEVVRGAEHWKIGLARHGLIFSPDLPHVAQACGDEIAVPFDRLAPYLTQDAARFVRALQAERVAPGRPTAR